MKRAPIKYDVKIDLHGLTTMQAFYKTLEVIRGAYKEGLRNILFITGIGDESRGTGAIRREFLTYTEHPSVADAVLGAKYLHGCFLVKLRKQSKSDL
jgi:DNA-nicking Smr family endonuclease